MAATYCVFGEGPNDFGVVEWGGTRITQEGCYSGFLKALCDKADLQCVKAISFRNLKIPGTSKKHPVENKLKGFRRHAYLAAQMAKTDEADILVIGTDVEKGRESGSKHTTKRVKDLSKYREEFKEGYEIACEEKPDVENVKLVVIVPLCKLESWLLADKKAFEKVAGFKRGELPKKPEQMFGETDAKEFLDKIFTGRGRGKPDTETLFNIAKHSSPDVLSGQCPKSYKPFRKQCDNTKLFQTNVPRT